MRGLGAAAVAASLPERTDAAGNNSGRRFLRPPGALAEEEFLKRCIHCGQCGEVCPNRCINYFSDENGWRSIDTPYILPREKACILCMKCGDVCPTDAIGKIVREAQAIVDNVRMGRAVVDESLCLSYQGQKRNSCCIRVFYYREDRS